MSASPWLRSTTPRRRARDVAVVQRGRTASRSTRCYTPSVSDVISQRELRNDSGRIMRALDEGRSFVVTRNSVPVGELRPLRRRRLVDARAVTELFRGAARVDAEHFRRDLDASVDQTVDPRV